MGDGWAPEYDLLHARRRKAGVGGGEKAQLNLKFLRNRTKGERVPGEQPNYIEAEASLIARIRSGEEAAITELYDRYSGVVYSVALRVLGDTGSAEDVLQEIFIQLWRNPASFDSNRGSLAAWLAVVARNRAIDQLRKRRPQTELADVIIAVDPRLEDGAHMSRMIARIRQVLAALPHEQRSAVEMAFFEQLTHTEIAEKTGEPLGTIKSRIRSALLSLREALAA